MLLGALLLAGALPLIPAAAEGEIPCADPRGCPDLWVDAARMQPFVQTRTFSSSSCAVVEGMVEPGARRLLRFTFTTPNDGPGDLVIGAPAQHPEWFVWSPCHAHYHFREYADYRLWTPAGYAAWKLLREANPDVPSGALLAEHPLVAEQMVSGHKQGFCVIDIIRYQPGAVSRYRSCSSNQGISVGWADEYHASLDGQWVDITNVLPGVYWLEAEVNAERYYRETDYADNSAFTMFRI
ncbi:MAG TPA: lysyl oxidase family protein [Candidatus Thermoplasmatota archaeon]|nr:lysyl oxidase family protein [Candidatus Thermoplasmatota archaeon]